MEELIGLIGWVAAVAMFGAFSNYYLKVISRDYLKKLPKKYADFADAYRSFMKIMIRRHRYFGLAALVLFPVHAAFVLIGSSLSITGLIAGLALIATASLGIYGFYIKKDLRAKWLVVHRAFAFVVFFTVISHLVFKAVISL